MSYSLDLTGLDEAMAALQDVIVGAEAGAAQILNFVVQSAGQRAKNKIRNGSPSGKFYGTHRASAPGEPPADWSGHLADSIRWTLVTENNLKSGASLGVYAAYADELEFGGIVEGFRGNPVWIEPRPFMEPSVLEAVAEVEPRMASIMERNLR